MIPPSFEYHSPTSVSEAIQLLTEHADDAKLLAGGHSLLPMMKLRFAEPEHLIDLNKIDELRGIRAEGDDIIIGAMTVENALIGSDILKEKVPLLPEAATLIADPQVRSRGTIGGDIAHGDPGNDHPALMLALDAVFTLTGPNGSRQVNASDFFIGMYMTALEPDEILTDIRIKQQLPSAGTSYHKLKRKTGDYATAAAAAYVEVNGGVCQNTRIALTNLAPCAIRVPAAEALINGSNANSDVIAQAVDAVMEASDPAEDLRGDVEYKTHMGGEMARRAILEAVERAGGI